MILFSICVYTSSTETVFKKFQIAYRVFLINFAIIFSVSEAFQSSYYCFDNGNWEGILYSGVIQFLEVFEL